MDKPTDKFKRGQERTIIIPLSNEGDICIHLIFYEYIAYHYSDSKRYLDRVHITYQKEKIVHNIVEVYRFKSEIKAFVDKKINFMHKDIYFEPKVKNNISRLQCNFNKDRYISMVEAMQIYSLLQEIFWGYSKVRIFDEFTVNVEAFKGER